MPAHSTILKVFLILLILSAFSCAVNPVTGRNELMFVSEQQEIAIGKDASPSANWEFGGEYHDPALQSYLNRIVKQLWTVSERNHLPFEFHIQNSSIPNAFALPGYVAITRGLLADMENEAQFAAVMGHEIGHVMARHTAQRISKGMLQQLGLSVGAIALQGSSGSDALLQLGAIGSSLMLLKYDREQELQADRLGVKYMSEIGYDPREAVEAHKVLERSANNYMSRMKVSARSDTFMSELLSTHPRTSVRLEEINEMISVLPPYALRGDGKSANAFKRAKDQLSNKSTAYYTFDEAAQHLQKKEYSKAEGKVKEAIRLNGSEAIFHNLLGEIKLITKDFIAAETSFKKAVSLYPNFQPAVYGLGSAYFFGNKYSSAIEQFRFSISLYPQHALSHFGLGKSYYELADYSKAIPYLKAFAGSAPDHDEIHGLLGICFDRTQQMQSAVIAYKNQLQVAPDTDLGRHARKRLAEINPIL